MITAKRIVSCTWSYPVNWLFIQILGEYFEYDEVEKEIKNPRIDMSIESKGILSIITIKDNAGGINEKNQELIFDPYYSTKESSKGTGLGLYIPKLIIERNMGGELSVYNDEEGAIFKIVIAG